MINDFSIKLKITSLGMFSAVMFCAMVGLALYLINGLADDLKQGNENMENHLALTGAISNMSIAFLSEVKLAKDVWIRGADPEILKKYRGEYLEQADNFEKYDTQALDVINRLVVRHAEFSKFSDMLKKLSSDHKTVSDKYLAQIDAHKGNTAESDAKVAGMDRDLSKGIVDLRAEIIKVVNDNAAEQSADAEQVYQHARNIMVVFVLLVLTMLGVTGVWIIKGINVAVSELRNVMVRITADGNLNARVKVYSKDEIGQAAAAFNGLAESFANIIRQVINSAGLVTSTAAQLSVSSAQISQGSQAQSEAAASTAAAVEQITVSINSMAENTGDVRKLSEKSLDQTQQGNQSVISMIGEIGRVQEAVNQIAVSVQEFVSSTRAITGMTQQVKDIADQTNLLALNAAIEAARAGEQGRGFAVVADEVRKLAEKSAKSASEIDQVTNSLNQKSNSVDAVVQTGLSSLQATQEQVGRVSALLSEAGDAVTKSSHGVSDIAAAISEQSLASTEIARNVEKIAQMSEQNHAALQSNTRDIVRLEGLAKDLQAAVSRFKV